MRIFKRAIPLAVIIAMILSLLAPAAPAYAWLTHTWDTRADFDACLLNNVDTAYSPNNVVLASTLDTGDGYDWELEVYDVVYYNDAVRSALASTSYKSDNRFQVNSAAGFWVGMEILVIQMTGQGAGAWETCNITGISGNDLLTSNQQNTYYVDSDSKAQVLYVPHYTEVDVYSDGVLTCHDWDGSTGGVLFFRATGTVTVYSGGMIEASDGGFSGGGSGGGGARGGSGGSGGVGGGDDTRNWPNGGAGGDNGTGGEGGATGVAPGPIYAYWGGDGGLTGSAGYRNSGMSGEGPGGGASDCGGVNDSTANLSSMQMGSSGGGGSSGKGGVGAGGGGGGGYNSCIEWKGWGGGPWDGKGGDSGGYSGSGGNGGPGGGIIVIHAKSIVVEDLIKANGGNGTTGAGGSDAGAGGKGGRAQNWCFFNSAVPAAAGGGGGGGGGGQGGGGGNGGSGGSGGTVWLAANNIAISPGITVAAVGSAGVAGGGGGSGGSGGKGGYGGDGDHDCHGKNGDRGPDGSDGATGANGGKGGKGKIRLDYRTLSGSTNPAPSYVSGLYYNTGAIASDVVDSGAADQAWQSLSWEETLPAGTNIAFEARASDTLFTKDAPTPAWISVGGVSPVTSGLPSGHYMQWRATLTTNNTFYSPVLNSVTIAYANAPEVTTRPATNIASSSATLNGTLVYLGPSSVDASVVFQMSETSGGPYNNVTSPQWMTAPGDFQADLSGLTPNTTYYYRTQVISQYDGTSYGDEMSFHTSMPPVVITNSASSMTTSSARLNGALTSPGDATSVDVSFQWGTTQGGPYPNFTTPQAMTAPGAFDFNLSGLSPYTTYYFVAKGAADTGNISYGAEMSFITSNQPPSVYTNDATSLTSSSATLNGALAGMGSATTVNVYFQWGTTQGGPYPNSTAPQTKNAAGSFSAGMSGLTANKGYYVRAVADGGSHGVSYGSEVNFTTDIVQPTVVTVGATDITAGSATLNGRLTSLGSASAVEVTFFWGVYTDDRRYITPYQTLCAPGAFQAGITDLLPDTTYSLLAYACGDGLCIQGAELTFHTAKAPPSVSTNEATDITTNSATLNGTLHDLGAASTVNASFQYGTTSGMYSNETPEQALSAPADFQSPLAGLPPATTYYYRAKGNGGTNGISYGTEHIYTTGSTPPAVATDNASNLTTNSAMLNGNLTGLGTAATVNVSFQYGTTQGGPYSNSTISQAKTAAGVFQINLTGLSSRTTYYYRARADGGIHGTDYGAEASFQTGSFPPYVETLPATGTTDHASTLNGKLHFLGSAATVNVSFEYGTTRGGPYPDTTPPQAKTASGTFDAALAGLTPLTTYYYRATGDGGAYGASKGAEMSFTTGSSPPSVTTDPATDITASSATLNGSLVALGDNTTPDVLFQWGKWQGGPYLDSTPQQAMGATGAFQAGLGELEGNTTYYYRAVGEGGTYGTAYGAERSFITPKVPPIVETDNATPVGSTTAELRGFLESLGTAKSVDTWFVYGKTSGGPYTHSTPHRTKSARGFLLAPLNWLDPLTTYYFRAEADGGAHGAAEGEECHFTTSAIRPSISTGGATFVAVDSATLNGTLHSRGSAPAVEVSFQYGTRSGVYGNETPLQLMGASGDFNANLSGLHPGTTYYYRARGDGGIHGISYGQEHYFTTGTHPPIVATVAATHMTTDSAALNGNLDNLGTATMVNTFFVYGATAGGPYTGSTTPQAMTSAGPYQTYVTGLSPNTTYYYKTKGDGGIYGAAYGTEMSFTTNRLPPVMGTGGAEDIMTNAAVINGNLYLMGSATSVDASFEYGTTQGGPYPNSTALQSMNEPDIFVDRLTGLSANTTYYYRSKGAAGADGTGYGEEQAFTTGAHPPIVVTVSAGAITDGSATLNGDLLNPGSAGTVNVRFEYATTQRGPYFNATFPQAVTAAGAFSDIITGLSPNTIYYYRTRADGGIYGTSFGSEKSFITPSAPPVVTTGAAASVTAGSAVLNGDLTSMGGAETVNVSFLFGTTGGGPYSNITPPQAMTIAGAFSANLAGLSPQTTYYYVAKGDGGIYGTAFGAEMNFTTANSPEPVPPAPPQGTPAPHGSSGGVPSTIPPIMPVSLPNVVVQSATLSSGRVSAGDPVAITATVYNRGTVNGSTIIKLTVNGQVESVRSLTLESGKSRTIIFTTVQNSPGTYNVYVGGVQAGSFVVEEYVDPDIILFISMALVFTSLVLAVMYVWRRRQQEYY